MDDAYKRNNKFLIGINDNECITAAGYQFGYFIEYWDKYFRYTSDRYISKKIKMEIEDYRKIMLDQFNGHIALSKGNGEEEVYFNDTEDVHNACIWIQSMIIMNKLASNKD